MRPELDAALVRDFPNLYRNRNNERSCFYFGFECGDGWEPMLRELSQKLEAIIVAMPARRRKNYAAEQVKEKFGSLRFYIRTTDEMSALIAEAEAKSMVTCESCGEPGERTSVRGWITTTCEACASKRNS